jgi:mannose-6-phosphate isomerase-like protein (cupin superfamily)
VVSRFGDVYENRVTGEHAVILRGSEDAAGGPAVVHLVARPGARVIGEHVHPGFAERFRVIRGRLTTRIAGEERALGPGEQGDVPAGVRHDWWNASSTEEAHVIVEIFPPEPRFELLIGSSSVWRTTGR